jgi:hypothetical protein
MAEVELLEKASHSDRSQGLYERINAGASQFGGARRAAVNGFYRIHGAIASGYHFARIFDPDRQFTGLPLCLAPKPIVRGQQGVDRGTFRARNMQTTSMR